MVVSSLLVDNVKLRVNFGGSGFSTRAVADVEAVRVLMVVLDDQKEIL